MYIKWHIACACLGFSCSFLLLPVQSVAILRSNLNSKVETTQMSPRAFLESQPDGVYTVLRVQDKMPWGRDFHQGRLQESFCLLHGMDSNEDPAFTSAQSETNVIITALLGESPSSGVCALTLLWWRCSTESGTTITVCGHLWETNVSAPTYPTTKVKISSRQSPNRLELPQAKLSSWCRKRRPLECDNYDEIILLDTEQNILEGLTSNLFVVQKDGSIQTASRDVLPGYVRHCILSLFDVHTTAIGLNFSDVDEVFMTSSIRLVIPVASVSFRGQIIWEYEPQSNGEQPEMWRRVYDTLVSHHKDGP